MRDNDSSFTSPDLTCILGWKVCRTFPTPIEYPTEIQKSAYLNMNSLPYHLPLDRCGHFPEFQILFEDMISLLK